MPTPELDGICVLVTRPVAQCEELVQRIESCGGSVFAFPVLEIVGPEDPLILKQTLAQLDSYDVLIFVSANAVEYGLVALKSAAKSLSGRTIAAVGRKTAEALITAGFPPQIVPGDTYNSEALLALAALQQVNGKRVLIFRGTGGRELLADSLRARGAQVDYAECYRRQLPSQLDTKELNRRGRSGEIDIVTVTSNQGLQNLHELVGAEGRLWLHHAPLVVVSARAAALAAELGFEQTPWVTPQVSDSAIVATLMVWRQERKNHRGTHP